jgi:hypothetical protein
MPISSPIVTGENYTADDINNLRTDVLSGHTHDGVEGVKVPFKNLAVTGTDGSTRPSGGNVSYDEIEAHIASTQGAHGLNAVAHIIGGNTSGLLVQMNEFSPNLGGSPNGGASGWIDFPISYSATPLVFFGWNGTSPNGWAQISAKSRSATNFEWYATASDDNNNPYMTRAWWLAIGVKNP